MIAGGTGGVRDADEEDKEVKKVRGSRKKEEGGDKEKERPEGGKWEEVEMEGVKGLGQIRPDSIRTGLIFLIIISCGINPTKNRT